MATASRCCMNCPVRCGRAISTQRSTMPSACPPRVRQHSSTRRTMSRCLASCVLADCNCPRQYGGGILPTVSLLAHPTVMWLQQTIGHCAEGDELSGRGASDLDCTKKQLFRTLLDVCISHHRLRCGAGI